MPPILRAPRERDTDEIGDLLAAREQADQIEPHHWRDLVLDQWRSRDFDPAVDVVVSEAAGGELIGLAALFAQGGFVAVHPEREGESAGTQLLAWLERRGREQGREEHRQIVGARNVSALELLERAGYQRVRSYIQMEKWLGPPLPPVSFPPGVEIAVPDPARDAAALHEFDELAFSANRDFQSHTLERFLEEHIRALDSDLSAVARRGDQLVGMVLCQRRPSDTVLIDLLAVAQDARRTGLGTALLLHACTAAAAADLKRVILFVASDNPGAFRVYERAGMSELHRADVFEKPAKPAGNASEDSHL